LLLLFFFLFPDQRSGCVALPFVIAEDEVVVVPFRLLRQRS